MSTLQPIDRQSARAAVLLRNSDSRQIDSPDRQRSLCLPHCAKNGYQVVGEYLDYGVAGDDFEFSKRAEFQRLLRDARAGKFDVVVYDEPERLSRQKTLSFIVHVFYPLHQTGVRLETVVGGPVSADDLVGFLMMAVSQEKASSESPRLSRRTLSKLLEMAKKGRDTGGSPPYGKLWVDDQERGKVLANDPDKAKNVRLMFDHIEQGGTIGSLREELRQRGIPSPSGKPWWPPSTLLKILQNRKYTGDMTYGVRSFGKHYAQAKGELRERRQGEPRYAKNPEEDWVICSDAHEAIIDREQWQRVQAKLKGNKDRTTPRIGGGPFVLSKMLVCSHCGSSMVGKMSNGKPIYICGGFNNDTKHRCHKNTVHEDAVLEALLTALQRQFLNPERLDELRAEIRRQEEAERDPQTVDALRQRITDLKSQIKQGNVNLATLPSDRHPGVIAVVREWEEQLALSLAELDRLTETSLIESLDAEVEQITSHLWDLREAIQEGDPAALRASLRELVSRVELRFTHKTVVKYTRSKLVGGTIHLRPEEAGAQTANLFTARTRSEQVGRFVIPFVLDDQVA
jgi:site-specific DNA recombinase